MKKNVLVMFLVFAIALVAACGGQGSSGSEPAGEAAGAAKEAKKEDIVIGFSNSFNGNTYRQIMEKYFIEAAEELKANGEISEYIIVEANNNVNTQISQIENLILKGVDAIIVDPGSATALDGAIAKATAAGIPVVIVNDGPVTSKDAYQINFDLRQITRTQAEYVAARLNGKGNVLVMRGVAGTEADKLLHEGITEVFSKYPDIEIVAEVNADWTHTVAQTKVAAILPSLPKIDAIVGQGGDDYGAIMAFEAAGLEVPLVTGGNRGYFMNWWGKAAKERGYETISSAANPWVGTAGLYVAMEILAGTEVRKEIIMPSFVVTQDELPMYENIPAEEIASPRYDRNWVIENLIK